MANPIYLDYNATTPIDREVAAAMKPFLEDYFGNPSSSHSYGLLTRKAIEQAREQVARLLHCFPDEVIFTSGGTESNNMAIKGAAFAFRHKGRHIITSAVEHPAVTEVCKYLETQDFEVTYLPVDEYGMVSPEILQASIRNDTILVSIMHANNEVGTIQPIAEISGITRRKGIILHTDAAQSPGKIRVDVEELGVDLLSVAGHKFYAPKGIGALYIRRGIKLEKLIHGANHERNLRAGTENILEIAGLGKACEIAARYLEVNMKQLTALRDRLYDNLSKELEHIRLNGHPGQRLPNTLNISFRNIEANLLLAGLNEIAASAGAACHAGDVDVSAVLKAMQVPMEYAMGAIRFSVGKHTTSQEIDNASDMIIDAVKRLQASEQTDPQITIKSGKIRLTQYTHGLGCACKLPPRELESILKKLPPVNDKAVLVGTGSSDDAAVYQINEEQAIVQTIDFFTPIVDEPYHFGAIAAANAMSDIYAMGGKPLFALNIAGFPLNRLPMSIIEEILKGAQDKASEAGLLILGGHTIDDTEPKFGMAVTGIIHPQKVLKNNTAKAGDALVLTKALGTGIIATALKRGTASSSEAEAAIKLMSELNKTAAEVMAEFPVSACTDITGFGLLGHLREMTTSSKTEAEISFKQIPILDGVTRHAASGMIPGGSRNNLDFVSDVVRWSPAIPDIHQLILCDAQTSGGLLIAVPETCSNDLLGKLLEKGVKHAAIIGRVTGTGPGHILVKD